LTGSGHAENLWEGNLCTSLVDICSAVYCGKGHAITSFVGRVKDGKTIFAPGVRVFNLRDSQRIIMTRRVS
jgi:hypothetical protein